MQSEMTDEYEKLNDPKYCREMEQWIDIYVDVLKIGNIENYEDEEYQKILSNLEKITSYNSMLIKKINEDANKLPYSSNTYCHKKSLDSFINMLSDNNEDEISMTTLRQIALAMSEEIHNITTNKINHIEEDF